MLAIVRKTIYEKRFSLLAWAIGAGFMVWVTLIFYPSFSQSDQLSNLIKSLPPKLQGIVGNANDFKTLGGYIDSVIFNLRVPMVTVTMAILFGIMLSAGDEEQGTMSTLLAQPVTRARVLWQKFWALVIGIAAVHIGIFLGLIVALLTIGYSYSIGLLVAVTFGSFLLSMLFGVLAFGLGLVFGKKGLASTLAVTVTFLTFLLQSLAPSVKSLQHIQKISPFYYYAAPETASHGLDWSFVSLQLLIIGVCMMIAWAVFRHRDIEV